MQEILAIILHIGNIELTADANDVAVLILPNKAASTGLLITNILALLYQRGSSMPTAWSTGEGSSICACLKHGGDAR